MEKSKISLWTIIGIVTVLAITSIFLVIFVPIHLISLWAGFLLGAVLVKAKSIHGEACNLKIKQDVEREFDQAINLQEKDGNIFYVDVREEVLPKEDNAVKEEALPELEVKVAVENQKEEALTVTAAPKKKSRKKSASTTPKTEAKKKNKKKEA